MAVENQPTYMSICAINQWDWLNYITGATLHNEYWKLVQLVILFLNCSLLPSSEICLGQSHCRQLLLCRSDGLALCTLRTSLDLHHSWNASCTNTSNNVNEEHESEERQRSKAQTSGGKKTKTLPHMCEKPQTKPLHVQWANSAENMPVLWHCNFLKSQINVIETRLFLRLQYAVQFVGCMSRRGQDVIGEGIYLHTSTCHGCPCLGPFWPCGPSASDILLLDHMGPLCPTGTHSH